MPAASRGSAARGLAAALLLALLPATASANPSEVAVSYSYSIARAPTQADPMRAGSSRIHVRTVYRNVTSNKLITGIVNTKLQLNAELLVDGRRVAFMNSSSPFKDRKVMLNPGETFAITYSLNPERALSSQSQQVIMNFNMGRGSLGRVTCEHTFDITSTIATPIGH
ncbi:MAG: hypothetical protein K6A65_00880 [Succinivibrionaceae bacterium]|nr:hypothetical protein [Succinivibrionaceae bacterium]